MLQFVVMEQLIKLIPYNQIAPNSSYVQNQFTSIFKFIQEYSNQCEADCEGATDCTSGQCPNPCVCTLEYRPVCCPDLDKEYSNPCGAACDGLDTSDLIACHYCDPDDPCAACTLEYNPQCCDGVDYANPCMLQYIYS